jgi:hypothetical protein
VSSVDSAGSLSSNNDRPGTPLRAILPGRNPLEVDRQRSLLGKPNLRSNKALGQSYARIYTLWHLP